MASTSPWTVVREEPRVPGTSSSSRHGIPTAAVCDFSTMRSQSSGVST
eukprot:CAMPEP_0180270296 /NCGR_PEP_ID=MMETSP0988-20121125/3110_1 /TAXON_ID=697907 /ORGANISM="non described non described, Strain CCMP2293" /LENGTH=47 /DNA_ID= /DNA_START= /DNA_END= /DNA_ORIENTATION=